MLIAIPGTSESILSEGAGEEWQVLIEKEIPSLSRQIFTNGYVPAVRAPPKLLQGYECVP